MCGSCFVKFIEMCSGAGNRREEGCSKPERRGTQPILHHCAKLVTSHPEPHWTSKNVPKFAKATDMCSTLGNEGNKLH